MDISVITVILGSVSVLFAKVPFPVLVCFSC
jgi:hypothetical protein